jgi:hypothetical protein
MFRVDFTIAYCRLFFCFTYHRVNFYMRSTPAMNLEYFSIADCLSIYLWTALICTSNYFYFLTTISLRYHRYMRMALRMRFLRAIFHLKERTFQRIHEKCLWMAWMAFFSLYLQNPRCHTIAHFTLCSITFWNVPYRSGMISRRRKILVLP